MIATTIINSISVNPRSFDLLVESPNMMIQEKIPGRNYYAQGFFNYLWQ